MLIPHPMGALSFIALACGWGETHGFPCFVVAAAAAKWMLTNAYLPKIPKCCAARSRAPNINLICKKFMRAHRFGKRATHLRRCRWARLLESDVASRQNQEKSKNEEANIYRIRSKVRARGHTTATFESVWWGPPSHLSVCEMRMNTVKQTVALKGYLSCSPRLGSISLIFFSCFE